VGRGGGRRVCESGNIVVAVKSKVHLMFDPVGIVVPLGASCTISVCKGCYIQWNL